MSIAVGFPRDILVFGNGGTMRSFLRFIDLAIGAGLVAVGLLLAGISWFGITQAPDTDAFRLIQFHFVFCGAISVLGSITRQVGRILASFSMLFIIGNGVLAWHAINARDLALLWPAGFVIASIINYAWFLVAERANNATGEVASSPADASTKDESLVQPDFGAPPDSAYIAGAGRNIIASALQIALSLAIIVLGAIYLELLRQAIFEHSNYSLSNVFQRVFGDPGKSGLIELGIYLIIPVVVLGFYFAIDAVLNIFVARSIETKTPDLRRDLTREERIFLRDSLKSLLDYLDGKNYPPAFRAAYAVGIIGVIVSFIAVPAGVLMVEGFFARALEISRVSDETIYYSGALYAGGAIGGFFAGTLLFWSLYQKMGARNPALAEYLFARAGWNSASNGPRSPFDMIWVLARHVRRRLIDVKASFDPAAFLYAAFRERETLIYKAALFSIVATVALGAADVARFQRVDADGVSYSKYFHFVSRQTSFADLDRVEVRCVLFSPDDDGEINLGLDYLLVKDGEFRIDLLDGSESDPDWLAQFEALDAKLADSGVPVERAKNAGFLRWRRPPFIGNCAEEIAGRYPPEIVLRLNRLLRVDRLADG